MREIKFRVWNGKEILSWEWIKAMGYGQRIFEYPELYIPMQFTGLRDRNGKEIYEKDLWKLGDEIYLIEWLEGDWQTGWKKKAGDNHTDIGQDNAKVGEVIGNIYENPEGENGNTRH